MQRKLEDGRGEDINIPRAQLQNPAPPLKDIEGRNRDRKKATLAAYETGAYSYQQIAKRFGVHFTTVGRVVRETKEKPMSKRSRK